LTAIATDGDCAAPVPVAATALAVELPAVTWKTSTQSASPWLLLPLAVELNVGPEPAELVAVVIGSTQDAVHPAASSAVLTVMVDPCDR
jgi:hypothetical protein